MSDKKVRINKELMKLCRKLAIISLRYCVSYYGRRDIDGLAAELYGRLAEEQ